MLSRSNTLLFNAIALAVSAAFLAWVGITAVGKRSVPAHAVDGETPLYRAKTQRDVYEIYKHAGLQGTRVVHLNRFLNMLDYFPMKEATSTPFPVQTYDIRRAYEAGLDSHTWLFIAARTAMVRAVTAVMPADAFRSRHGDFLRDHAFSQSGRLIRGFAYDVPLVIGALDALPRIVEPVVLNVDAGYFSGGEDPIKAANALREKCPDVRMAVMIDSTDEPDVTDDMRERLRRFEAAWQGI